MLRNKQRKEDGRKSILRMVSSLRGRSAGISDFNLTFAQHYAPASLPGQALCIPPHPALCIPLCIPPVHKKLPETEIIFPVKYLERSVPQPVTEPVAEPDRSNPTAYGKYMVSIAGCADCHTPQSKGQNIPGMDFVGGFIWKAPGAGGRRDETIPAARYLAGGGAATVMP
jgi:hypothetical protein